MADLKNRASSVGQTGAADAQWSLLCGQCGATFELGPLVFGCPICAGSQRASVLEVRFNPSGVPANLSERNGKGFDRYRDLLPGGKSQQWLSLGEGGTPMIRSRIIGPQLGLTNLYFKNETANPTWSFKDRYVAVTTNLARSFGFRRTVVSSTGNLGVSVAAYSAAAGMDCVFLAKEGTTSPILNHARHHGSHVFVASSEGYRGFAQHLARSGEWFPVGLFMPWAISNPFGVEGYKTFAYEMIEDLGRAPEAVLFPCARGNGLYGAWKGFLEAFNWGWTDHKPRMVGCQPLVANSLAISMEQGAAFPVELPPARSVAVSTCETVSSPHALDAIRASRGAALSAGEDDILAAVDALGGEGLCVEAASALPVACLRALLDETKIDPTAPIVCVLTAAGIKWPHDLAENGPPIIEIDDDPDTLDRCLAEAGL